MATYKVIQDIEADDKLIWMLSFRQFVYALIAALFFYISFIFYVKHVSFMLIFSLPIASFAGFLAFPFGKDQPTEVWALAKIRFLLKPRRRIWAQSGVKQLVTITVPKKLERNLTNGLSQNEVKSRLQALANTIDSRGWAIKNVGSEYINPISSYDGSDRLLSPVVLPNDPDSNPTAGSDFFDIQTNPTAQKMNELIINKDIETRQRIKDTLDGITQSQPLTATPTIQPQTLSQDASVVQPLQAQPVQSSLSDQAIDDELKERAEIQSMPNQNLRRFNIDNTVSNTTKSISSTRQKTPAPEPIISPIINEPKPIDPAIINLSGRNDLNVDVLAHEINRAKNPGKLENNQEVTISLR